MAKRCIVNVAIGSWYPKAQQRLRNSLSRMNFDGDLLLYTEYPKGSPTHNEVPYAFKTFAMLEALAKGYEQILWVDSSLWAVAEPIGTFTSIEKTGYVFHYDNWTAGQWCSDAAVQQLGTSREELLGLHTIIGGFWGINAKDDWAVCYLKDLHGYATDNVTYIGDWNNDRLQVSTDRRVMGHRHDQPAMTVLAQRYKFNALPVGTFFNYDPKTSDPRRGVEFTYCGM